MLLTHVLREAVTMGLYLSIVLLALIVTFGDLHERRHELAAIVGTAVGLGLADLFAFRLSARLFHRGTLSQEDAGGTVGLSVAVVAVGFLACSPYLLLPQAGNPSTVSASLLVAVIFVLGLANARGAGASRIRALVTAAATTVAGLAVVLVKVWLTGH